MEPSVDKPKMNKSSSQKTLPPIPSEDDTNPDVLKELDILLQRSTLGDEVIS